VKYPQVKRSTNRYSVGAKGGSFYLRIISQKSFTQAFRSPYLTKLRHPDPGLDPGSSALRFLPGYGSAKKPMRIRNTEERIDKRDIRM
jgi:hypothetical protein